MKKIISIFIIMFVSVNLFAQTNMIIRTTNGNTHSYPILEIDSVYYEETFPDCGTVTDYDGNTYQTVTIGTQCWMKNDLQVTHYPNGNAIPNITDNTTWGILTNNDTADAYCFYNNNSSTDYGALYTYAAAIGDNWQRDNDSQNSEGGQGVCPDGWHLPTDAEWTTLTNYLGGENVAGGKMKEIGTMHWSNPNIGADNSSGFSALPSGLRYNSGYFDGLGNDGYWWSATESTSDNAYYRFIDCHVTEVTNNNGTKAFGLSIRCIKD